jgi:hypothetical protein
MVIQLDEIDLGKMKDSPLKDLVSRLREVQASGFSLSRISPQTVQISQSIRQGDNSAHRGYPAYTVYQDHVDWTDRHSDYCD